ncbi:IMPACT family protein [Bacteroidota bacterium]
MNPKNTDIYYTIAGQKRCEIKVKSSKFIATAIPAPDKVAAKESLGTIRTEFFNATHNCFAYRIGPDGMEFRSSDDGEPRGSAGKPILFAIKKYDLSDLIVIVTRFFGGTKLGVGGLARAYEDSTEAVLKICKKKPVHITKSIKIFCTYEDINAVKQLVLNHAVSSEESYHDAVEIIADIHSSEIDKFIALLTEATAGRAGAVKL